MLTIAALFWGAIVTDNLWGYSTPNTGVSWTMDNLVANSAGAATGSFPNYQLHYEVVISSNDTLTIPAGSVITRDDSPAWPRLFFYGKLIAQGTVSNQIRFTSGPSRAVDTYDCCLQFQSSVSSNSIVEWVRCDNACAGIVTSATGIRLTSCTVSNCDYGVYVSSGSPILTNCTIVSCTKRGIHANTTLLLDGCMIMNNGGSQWGAGLYVGGGTPTVRNSVFYGNRTGITQGYWAGGGIGFEGVTGGLIQNCIITNNQAQYGSGLILYGCSNVSVCGCTVTLNRYVTWNDDLWWFLPQFSVENSGGITVRENPNIWSLHYYNSSGFIANNRISDLASEASSPTLAHNLISVAFLWTGVPVFVNNILTQWIYEYDAAADPKLTNNCFAASSGIYLNENLTTLDNVAQVNALPGNSGNIQGDPKIDTANWTLAYDSPCRDAGVDAGIAIDINGSARPVVSSPSGIAKPDIGPVEGQDHIWLFDPTVSPSSGTSTDTFTFSVHYVGASLHSRGIAGAFVDAPTNRHIYLMSPPGNLSLVSGTETNGVYQYQTKLGSGSHWYAFAFVNDIHDTLAAPLPNFFDVSTSWSILSAPTNTYSGPVVNDPPRLSNNKVSVTSGLTNTVFSFKVDYQDPDGDPPTSIYICFDGYWDCQLLSLLSGTGANGTYGYSGTLPPGAHTYTISCNDGRYGVNLGTSSSPNQGPYVWTNAPALAWSVDTYTYAYEDPEDPQVLPGTTLFLYDIYNLSPHDPLPYASGAIDNRPLCTLVSMSVPAGSNQGVYYPGSIGPSNTVEYLEYYVYPQVSGGAYLFTTSPFIRRGFITATTAREGLTFPPIEVDVPAEAPPKPLVREFRFGTNSVSLTTTNLAPTWRYTLQTSTDLTNWTDVTTFYATNSVQSWTLTPSNVPAQFFRLRAP